VAIPPLQGRKVENILVVCPSMHIDVIENPSKGMKRLHELDTLDFNNDSSL
jgi:hypothetical protein